MNINEIAKKIKNKISNDCIITQNDGLSPHLEVDSKLLFEIMELLKTDSELNYSFLENTICQNYVSHGEYDENKMVIIYWLRNLNSGGLLGIRIQVGFDEKNIKSLKGIWPSAVHFEDEISEMFGISFEEMGLDHFKLLPDRWKGHPLKKEYEYPEEFNEIEHYREPNKREHMKV